MIGQQTCIVGLFITQSKFKYRLRLRVYSPPFTSFSTELHFLNLPKNEFFRCAESLALLFLRFALYMPVMVVSVLRY